MPISRSGRAERGVCGARLGVGAREGLSVPVATPQSVTTDYEAAKAITLTGAGEALTYTIVLAPDWGVLSGTPPSVTYTPFAGFSGSDSFTFKVTSGGVDSAPATVSLTVNPQPFALEQLPGLQWYVDPAYEGGNEPAELTALAQNPLITDGAAISTFTDWSANGRHSKLQSGYTATTWSEGAAGAFSAGATTSYDLANDGAGGTTPPPVGQTFTLVAAVKMAADTGYTLTGAGARPGILKSSTATRTSWLQNSSLDFPDVILMSPSDTAWHVLVVAQDDTGCEVRWDGEVLFSSTLPAPDYADSLFRLFARDGNSTNLNYTQGPALISSQRLTSSQLIAIESLIGSRYGIAVGSAIGVTFPSSGAIYQRQSGGGGTIRARGTYDVASLGVAGIEARWNGGTWTAATLNAGAGTWTVEISSLDEVSATLEVRSTDVAYQAQVAQVGIGDVWWVIGQSNAGRISGASGSATYTGAAHAAVYDVLNYEGWGGPDDKHWAAQFLERARADRGVPVAIVRTYKGSTFLGQWLIGATEGYLAEAKQDLLDSQGIVGAYSSGTHGDLAVEVLCQWGERDSQRSTPQSEVQANIEAISGHISTAYGLNARWSRVQVLDISYASAANQAAYRAGVNAAVAAQAYILAGADLEALTTPTPWTGTDGVHPATVVELDAEGDEWADAVGLA